MIVRCPSCGTRYHYHSESPGASGLCSRCDDTVPLVAAKRNYVLRVSVPAIAGAGSVPASMAMNVGPLGISGEAIAPQVALDARHAETIHGVASALPRSDGRRLHELVTGAMGAPAVFDRSADGSRAAGFDAQQPGESRERAVDLLVEPDEVGVATPLRNTLREIVVSLLLSSLGLAAGYHVSVQQDLDPALWMALGAGWGLAFSWICLRWKRQTR